MGAAYRKLMDILYWTCVGVAGTALVLISAVVPWAVFTRYVLNQAASWPEATAVLLTIVLTFIGAATDDYLRAFDNSSGAQLWKGRLPAGPQATPMTYRLSPQGKQFVVIAAGGHNYMRTKLGDYLVAFSL